nr:MAG TPA: hypothetical protein [Caudoviricetes sp.]
MNDIHYNLLRTVAKYKILHTTPKVKEIYGNSTKNRVG